MKPGFSLILSVVLLRVLAGWVPAASTEAESSVFAMDLRDSLGTTEQESNLFTLEARDWGNQTGESSGSFALDTLGDAPLDLEIVGPATVTAGSQTTYAVKWHAGNSVLDVTENARWRFLTGAPGNSGMVPPVLYAGETTAPAVIVLVASYLGATGTSIESPPFAITILPRMTASLAATRASPNNGVVNLAASPQGATGTTVVNWDLDGDGQFDDATGETVVRDYGTWTGTTQVKVEVIDALGNRWIEQRRVTLNKPPVDNQPALEKPAYDPGGFTLHLADAARSQFQFDPARRDKGLVVIAHGLDSSVQAGWMQELGLAVEARCQSELGGAPNIALLDWSDLAGDPSELPLWLRITLEGLIRAGLKTVNFKAAAVGELGKAINFGFDLYYVREFGLTTGQQLANWIYLNSSLGASPQIDKSKPIHLIGHSAGGFVVGEAGLLLKLAAGGLSPVYVDRVTMLDTPFPAKAHFSMASGSFPNPGEVERYISSFYGDLVWMGAALVDPHPWYRRQYVFKSLFPTDVLSTGANGHGYSYVWYTGNTTWNQEDPTALENDGFAWSPIINASTRIAKAAMAPLPMPAPLYSPAALPDFVPSGWQSFGDAVEDAGTWTLTEQADAGMWAEVALPVASENLRFEFRFTQGGDGDFLAVHFGDAPVLFRGLDQALSRDGWLPVEIPLDLVGGTAGKLVFTLVSRGNANAQVQVANIRATQTDDPDGDGLTIAQEAAAGTAARVWDTDGDTLSDGDEVNVLLTDPTRADTDGDGQGDAAELAAGTDPLANGSVFRVTAIERAPSGSIVLRWPGVVGKTYRVMRSETLGTGNFIVLAHGIAGTAPATVVEDPEPPAGRAFYWVEVE